MPLTENEKITQSLYDGTAGEWLDHSGGRSRRSFWEGEMIIFTQLLTGKKIIEIGAGWATDGKLLIQKGFDCVSTDYSAGMLKLAQDLNTNDKLAQADMQKLPFGDNSFDGFWATACLLHIENTALALEEIGRVTKSGGLGFISVKEGEGGMLDSRSGYYFHYFSDDEFTDLLRTGGMQVIDCQRKTGTPRHEWLTYLVRVIK